MRHISFALTTDQIRKRSKTVTRRLGWQTLTPGTLLQPVVKSQGLKRGEHVEKIGGPIRVVSVRRERLFAMFQNREYGRSECVSEGFPQMQANEFAEMFCAHNRCDLHTELTRIEFEYVDAEPT